MSLAIVLSCYLSWIMSSNSSKPDYHAIEAKDWPDHNRKYPNDTVLAVADGTLIQTDTHWTRKGEYDEMFKLLKLVEGDDETDLFMSMETWPRSQVEKGGKRVMIFLHFYLIHKLDRLKKLFGMRKEK
eukprot:131200_1